MVEIFSQHRAEVKELFGISGCRTGISLVSGDSAEARSHPVEACTATGGIELDTQVNFNFFLCQSSLSMR